MSTPVTDRIGQAVTAAQGDGRRYEGFAYPCSLETLPTGKLLATFTGFHRTNKRPSAAAGVYSPDGGRSWSPPVTFFSADVPGGVATENYGDPNLVVVSTKRVMVFCVSLRHDQKKWDLSRTRFWRRISDDGGETFGPIEERPRHRKYYVGMVNPGLRLRNGTLVMGYSWDKPAEAGHPADGEGAMDLVSGVLISHDEGMTWQPGGDCYADTGRADDALAHATSGLDEPSIVELPDGTLFMLLRTGTSRLWHARSVDGGLTWSTPEPSPLVSHNCPASMVRLAGDDAVLVVYNSHPTHRRNLSASISTDGCRTWSAERRIAPVCGSDEAEAAYPNVCQLADGTLVAVFYQTDRKVEKPQMTIHAVRFTRQQVVEVR